MGAVTVRRWWILGGGSFSAKLPAAISSRCRNQFYLLEFPQDEVESLKLDLGGRFKAWAWNAAQGWAKASDGSGLPHTGGFGFRPQFGALARDLKARLGAERLASRGLSVQWDRRLAYLMPRDLDRLTRELDLLGVVLNKNQFGEPQHVGAQNRVSVAPPFASFNARALEPWEVARTFVAPPYFERLARKRHTVLVGPRGSGKTTVLKMLQSSALEAWSSPDAEKFREVVDYSSVFVPADEAWRKQLDSTTSRDWSEKETQVLSGAALTTQALMAFVRTLLSRAYPREAENHPPHRRVRLSGRMEAALADGLASAWRLGLTLPSLSEVLLALGRRMIDLKVLAGQLDLRAAESRRAALGETPWLHLPLIDSLVQGIEAFEAHVGDRGARWALLFDELEKAPDWIVAFLFSSMRSVDDRIVFKLSLSPYSSVDSAGPGSPHSGHDQETISLWFPRKEEATSFSLSLANALLKARGIDSDLPSLLGRSESEVLEGNLFGVRYHRDSKLLRVFQSLAERDFSFSRYLQTQDINLQRPETLSGQKRAETLRKVQAVVRLRELFRGQKLESQAERVRRRSRKNPSAYTGVADVLAVTEGNPRLLIGLLERLLDGYRSGSIHPSRQAKEIRRTRSIYAAFLRTIPCPTESPGLQSRGLLGMLNQIGTAFEQQLHDFDFNPEPPGSFTVDSRVRWDLLKALGEAVNAGAIVYVPDENGELVLASFGVSASASHTF